jgi:hypothetical protein
MIAKISYNSQNLLSNRKHQNFVICAMSHNHEAVPFQFINDLKALDKLSHTQFIL